MLGKASKYAIMQTHLVALVEDYKRTLVLGFRSVLKVVNVFTDNLPVGDEEALPVDHVRNHHDLIILLIGKLERGFRRLDIKGHDYGLGTLHALRYARKADLSILRGHRVP